MNTKKEVLRFAFTVSGVIMMVVGDSEAEVLTQMITRHQTDFELIDCNGKHKYAIMDNVKMGMPDDLTPATVIHSEGRIIVCSKMPDSIESTPFIKSGVAPVHIDASKKNYYWPMKIVKTSGDFVKLSDDPSTRN